MNCYEFIYALNVNLDQQKVDEFNNKIQSFIMENFGKIDNFDIWGLKKLAYPIKKKQEANFYLLRFQMEPKYILEFRDISRLNENVLRFNIMKIEKDFSIRKKKFKKNVNNEEKNVKEEVE